MTGWVLPALKVPWWIRCWATTPTFSPILRASGSRNPRQASRAKSVQTRGQSRTRSLQICEWLSRWTIFLLIIYCYKQSEQVLCICAYINYVEDVWKKCSLPYQGVQSERPEWWIKFLCIEYFHCRAVPKTITKWCLSNARLTCARTFPADTLSVRKSFSANFSPFTPTCLLGFYCMHKAMTILVMWFT